MSALVMQPLINHSSLDGGNTHSLPSMSFNHSSNKPKSPDFVHQTTANQTADVSKTETAPDAKEEKASIANQEKQRHEANICQKKNIVPPKKMKKKSTVEELQMVLRHYDIARNKNMEDILSKHEAHVLQYRDTQYLAAKERGITANSEDEIRLKILTDVVTFTFMNIEPPNDYTKKTDRKHFKEVSDCTAKFAQAKGMKASVALIYSAMCHDIERFLPCTKCEYLPEAVDKYRKQIIHGETSAKVALCLLKGAPVSAEEKETIYEIIRHHDSPNPRKDMVILDRKLVEGISEDLMKELAILMDADSFSFFQSTIAYFIEFKSKKNSPDWIWQRVKVNIKRLTPSLRPKAAQLINALPDEVRNKMAIDDDELAQVVHN